MERAKTGDLLKAKIQQRPNRQELERRHILEHEECHVDPSLAEKQRMLKKARLADQLNSQISHRPGPLELIKKNILHTEKPIERIVKEGLVTFKATSEGLHNRPQQPNSYITFEDDSQSSESDTRNTPPRQDVIEAAAASAGIVTVALTIPTSGGAVVVTSAPVLQTKFHPTLISTPYIPPPPPPPPGCKGLEQQVQVKQDTSNLFAELCQSVAGPSQSPSFLPLAASPASLGSSTSTLSPLSSVASPPQSITPKPVQSPLQQFQQSQKSDAPGKDKNRKKSKSKPVSKARTIKFHEYKGPPNAQKNSSSDSNQPEETSYQLMLEQQNCLLRFLEKLNKNQTILPAPPKSTSSLINENSVQSTTPHPPPLPSPALSVSSSIPPSPAPSHAESISSDVTKLEKMKVSDLKMHLKKRNLPISGPKTQLIERLKPYLPLEGNESSAPESISGETCDVDLVNSPRHSMSPESEHENMDTNQTETASPMVITLTNEDIVREQQRKIDELQRQLQKSQQELQQIKQSQQKAVVETHTPPPPINQKLVVKQQLEAKIQKQQANRAAQLALKNKTPALIAPKEEKPKVPAQIPIAAKPPSNVGLLWNGENQTLFLVGLQDKKLINGHQRAASMPSIVFPFPTTQTVEQIIETKPLIQPTLTSHESIPHIQMEIKPPPPLYEEATKQLSNVTVTVKEEPTVVIEKNIKSENLTDVLDILIKNGELPESALDPTTPTTAGTTIAQNIIFTNSNIKGIENNSQVNNPPQSLQTNGNANSLFPNSILLDTPSPIENIEMASPIQPDCHIDTENVAKTLDIFLEPQQEERALNTSEINHFDDLELFELMSQQLDMDISDETCHNFPSSDSQQHNHHNQQQHHKLSSSGINTRRDMNPSLQPSISELIQQQQQRHNNSNNNNNNGNAHNNNNNNNNRNDGNSFCSGLTNGFDVDHHNFDLNGTNNNYSSTPMDVCDDFDSALVNFGFTNLSHDSNINTPPHPFSSSLSTISETSNGSGPQNLSCSSNGIVGSNGSQLYNGGTSDSDSFSSHIPINQDNILDLFNIDDYKMSWGEVDFAV